MTFQKSAGSLRLSAVIDKYVFLMTNIYFFNVLNIRQLSILPGELRAAACRHLKVCKGEKCF